MSRPPLSHERVVDAASRVADASGLAGVSMRSVGRELGVEAMSLYHHVAGKDALLDGLADWVFARITLPRSGMRWRAEMEERARSARAVLAAHPWGLGLLESRRSPGPATLGHHDAVLGCLRTAGFSVALAAHAFSVLDAYTYGFVLTEVNLPFEPGESAEDFVADLGAALADLTRTSRRWWPSRSWDGTTPTATSSTSASRWCSTASSGASFKDDRCPAGLDRRRKHCRTSTRGRTTGEWAGVEPSSWQLRSRCSWARGSQVPGRVYKHLRHIARSHGPEPPTLWSCGRTRTCETSGVHRPTRRASRSASAGMQRESRWPPYNSGTASDGLPRLHPKERASHDSPAARPPTA